MAKTPKKLTQKDKIRRTRIDKRKALVAWSQEVRERDGHKCQICGIHDKEINKNGKKTILNAHHVICKEGTFKHLMFDVGNGLCLCTSCHKFSRRNSPHKQEFVFFLWFMENRPDQFKYLKDKLKEFELEETENV